jgi:hypothetical protein
MGLKSDVFRKPKVGCAANSGALGGCDGRFRCFQSCPLLHLDEGEAAATDHDQVDFAEWGFFPL